MSDNYYEISYEQETIKYDCELPDSYWEFKDAESHVHRWVKLNGEWTIPTVIYVVDGTEFVGDEYESEEVEYGHHECRKCGETVRPQYRREVRCEPSGIVNITGILRSNEVFSVNEELDGLLLGLPSGTVMLLSMTHLPSGPFLYEYNFMVISVIQLSGAIV